MNSMFDGASSFNQNLGEWNIEKNTDYTNMLNNSGLSVENYENTIKGWADKIVKPNITLDANGLKLTLGGYKPKNILLNAPNNWTINDAGYIDNMPEIAKSIDDLFLMTSSINEKIEIKLDDYFYDDGQAYGLNLTYSLINSPTNANVEIKSPENILIITSNGKKENDSIVIEAVDLSKQKVIQSFNLFVNLDIEGVNYIKIHEYISENMLLYDYNSNLEAFEGFSYSIIEGNDLGIFKINNNGELKVNNQEILFKETSYIDSTFFDLKIKAMYLNEENIIETRIYIESIYKLNQGGVNNKVGINKLNKESVKLYPNPANDFFIIKSTEIIEKLNLYNLRGFFIKSYKLNDSMAKILLNDLNQGIYILKIYTKGKIVIKRIIINK